MIPAPTVDMVRHPFAMRMAMLQAIDAFEDWREGDPEPMLTVGDADLPLGEFCRIAIDWQGDMPRGAVERLSKLLRRSDGNPWDRHQLATYGMVAWRLWAAVVARGRAAAPPALRTPEPYPSVSAARFPIPDL
jgi:hypothetical protein